MTDWLNSCEIADCLCKYAFILNSVLALHYRNIVYIQALQINSVDRCFGVEAGVTAVNWDTACICWGSSGLLECRGHSWLLSMTLWWHQTFSTAPNSNFNSNSPLDSSAVCVSAAAALCSIDWSHENGRHVSMLSCVLTTVLLVGYMNCDNVHCFWACCSAANSVSTKLTATSVSGTGQQTELPSWQLFNLCFYYCSI